MILDKLLEFDPAGTAITATAASTNIIDLLNERDLGVGTAGGATPKLMVLVQQTFTAAGAGTLNVQFQGAPDNGSGVPGTYVTYAETGALALANLVAGYRIFDIDVPRPTPTPLGPNGTAATPPLSPPRFYRLNYVVATGPMTAGTVQAEIVLGRDDQVQYKSGFTVSN